jgi:hypothetical protein
MPTHATPTGVHDLCRGASLPTTALNLVNRPHGWVVTRIDDRFHPSDAHAAHIGGRGRKLVFR